MTDFPDTGLPGMQPSAIDLTRDGAVDKRPMVRVYQASPGDLALQLRSLGRTNQNGRTGAEKHIVSYVHLDAQQARRLGGLLIKWADQQKKGN